MATTAPDTRLHPRAARPRRSPSSRRPAGLPTPVMGAPDRGARVKLFGGSAPVAILGPGDLARRHRARA